MTAALAAVPLLLVAATVDQIAPDQPPNSIGVRLADVPVDQQEDPLARAVISAHLAPGGRQTRSIDIVSTVDSPVTVEIYGGNGRISDGSLSPDDTDRRGIADWIAPEASRITMDPMSVRRMEVAIEVPGNAPLGEQYGYVWVEPPAGEGEVAIANRVGIRVFLSVGTGAEPPVDFAVGSMTAARDSAGVPVVTTRLRNTGGRALTIGGELLLTEGPAGLTAGPFPFDGSLALAPGDVGTMTVSLDPELPDGPWLAQITASSGLLERTAEAEIVFPSGAGDEAPAEDTDTIGGTDAEGNDISEEIRNQRRTLLPLAAILILLAIGALYMMQQWKRRDLGEDDDEPVTAAVAAGGGETAAAVHDEGG